jgi:hypothetical protein
MRNPENIRKACMSTDTFSHSAQTARTVTMSRKAIRARNLAAIRRIKRLSRQLLPARRHAPMAAGVQA